MSVEAIDEQEAQHIAFAKEWVLSGRELYRRVKPDVPDVHLVSYCVVIDFKKNKILLGDHKDSGLWLPPGGHCDFNEMPIETAARELKEEIGLSADFYSTLPFFVSVTRTLTVKDKGHTDVGFWYVSKGNSLIQEFSFDQSEFSELKWFSLDDVCLETTDRHMGKFLKKLKIQREVDL